eukprot:3480582-Heterocapsa_arctica.AAC.1
MAQKLNLTMYQGGALWESYNNHTGSALGKCPGHTYSFDKGNLYMGHRPIGWCGDESPTRP